MPMKSADKVIVSNRAALEAKYGKPGTAAIYQALKRMITADKARGHVTVIVDINDAVQMKRYRCAPVVGPADQRGAKAAVDAINAVQAPDYFLLLDGPDVIPQIKLNAISGLNDGDRNIPSDLPFASDAAFSLKASSFLAVTRVVGRLPATEGETNHEVLVRLIDLAAKHTAKPRKKFDSYFAISADVWKKSTQLSLTNLFNAHTGLQLCPKATHTAIDKGLTSLVHFINCHGAVADPQFYGEKRGAFPIAMNSPQVAPHIRKGTVAAAECCYGGELYNARLLGAAQPTCMSYLNGGAVGFLGSTNIAYGPADANGQADLITQYFLESVLDGASIGRALLQARQRFVTSESMASATNLKTLAQFVLYGDPSLVAADLAGFHSLTAADRVSSRKARRIALTSEGKAAAEAASFPAAKINRGRKLFRRMREIARERDFSSDPEMFSVSGGTEFMQAMKGVGRRKEVVIFCDVSAARHSASGKEIPSVRVLIAHILGDGISAIEECVSR
jgi:hypothetical protein